MSSRGSLIAVVDDDESMCASVARVLGMHGFRVSTFTSAAAYLADLEAAEPVCLLADIRMPDIDGINLHRELSLRGRDVPTIFMTGSRDIPMVVEAMKEGGMDLLEKPFEADELLAAINKGVAMSEHAHRQRKALVEIWNGLARLTPREAEVCAYVAAGMLNKQVALAIGTTEKTVKVHRARVMQKLEAHSLADLVRIVDQAILERNRTMLLVDGAYVERPRAVVTLDSVLKRESLSPKANTSSHSSASS